MGCGSWFINSSNFMCPNVSKTCSGVLENEKYDMLKCVSDTCRQHVGV